MDLENVMVMGIEENMRGREHFNENFFWAWFEKLQVYIYRRTANNMSEYQMNV